MTHAVSSPSATKRVFRVNVRSTDYLWILVEADSAHEARNLAQNIDAQYFRPDWPASDWKIVDAKQANGYYPDQIAPPEAYGSL